MDLSTSCKCCPHYLSRRDDGAPSTVRLDALPNLPQRSTTDRSCRLCPVLSYMDDEYIPFLCISTLFLFEGGKEYSMFPSKIRQNASLPERHGHGGRTACLQVYQVQRVRVSDGRI